MRNLRALISYDGSKFFGWQRQDGFWSVQEAVEQAVEAATGEKVTVFGAGRTDTGVHALRQVANFHVESSLSDDRLRHALNAHISEGAAIERIETCDEEFHARFSACGKRYLYRIGTSRFRRPFPEEYEHWINQPLDLPAMTEAASALIGTQSVVQAKCLSEIVSMLFSGQADQPQPQPQPEPQPETEPFPQPQP